MAGFPEPSGLVYHAGRRTLFVVGDEGDVGEVSLDGRLLRSVHLGGDLESITINPASGLLYVAREGAEVVLELAPDELAVRRRFAIDRSFQGNPDFLKRGGDGIEGLAFVPDAKLPAGGSLWAVNQYDPPVLVQLDVPPPAPTAAAAKAKPSGSWQDARILRAVPVDAAPLSDLAWDAARRRFLVVSALWKRVSVLDAEGRLLGSVHIPGFLPEGVVVLPDGRVVIAQDSGGLLAWRPDGDPFAGIDGAEAPAAAPPASRQTGGPVPAPGRGPDAAAPAPPAEGRP